jgi:hypothetical protein
LLVLQYPLNPPSCDPRPGEVRTKPLASLNVFRIARSVLPITSPTARFPTRKGESSKRGPPRPKKVSSLHSPHRLHSSVLKIDPFLPLVFALQSGFYCIHLHSLFPRDLVVSLLCTENWSPFHSLVTVLQIAPFGFVASIQAASSFARLSTSLLTFRKRFPLLDHKEGLVTLATCEE